MAEGAAMALNDARKMMTARLVDSLYTEAMVLADEARSYFDEGGRPEREALGPADRKAVIAAALRRKATT